MYDWKKTIKKGVQTAILVGLLSLMFGLHELWPAVGSMTVGSVVAMAYNFLKHYWGVRLP